MHRPPNFLGEEKHQVVHVQIQYRRKHSKQERGSFGSLNKLSSTAPVQKRSGKNSIPSPLLGRTDPLSSSASTDDVESSSSQSFQQSARGERFLQQSARGEGTSQNQYSPGAYCAASISRPLTPHTQRQVRIPSPVTDTSGIASLYSYKQSSLLTRSQRSLPPENNTKRTLDASSSGTLSEAWSSSGSLSASSSGIYSSKSSPSLLEDTALQEGSQKVLHLDVSHSEEDVRKGLIFSENSQILDLFILNPRTDFYHCLCAAWHDQKTVSQKQ